jgi:hypothetical protein
MLQNFQRSGKASREVQRPVALVVSSRAGFAVLNGRENHPMVHEAEGLQGTDPPYSYAAPPCATTRG